MGAIKDIGRRIELIPMDSQFHEITIGLYRLEGERPSFLVHTYSQIEGVELRLAFLRKAMIELAGLVEEDGLLSFPCCHEHHAAVGHIRDGGFKFFQITFSVKEEFGHQSFQVTFSCESQGKMGGNPFGSSAAIL